MSFFLFPLSLFSLPFSELHEEIPVAPPTTAASSVEEPEGETLAFCLLRCFLLVTLAVVACEWGHGLGARGPDPSVIPHNPTPTSWALLCVR